MPSATRRHSDHSDGPRSTATGSAAVVVAERLAVGDRESTASSSPQRIHCALWPTEGGRQRYTGDRAVVRLSGECADPRAIDLRSPKPTFSKAHGEAIGYAALSSVSGRSVCDGVGKAMIYVAAAVRGREGGRRAAGATGGRESRFSQGLSRSRAETGAR